MLFQSDKIIIEKIKKIVIIKSYITILLTLDKKEYNI